MNSTAFSAAPAAETRRRLPEVRFHDLRHTFATLALQNMIHIKTVSDEMGHSTVTFTMDKYGHVSDTMQKDSAERMHRFIKEL